MDIVGRVKECWLLIKEEQFDGLTKDTGFSDSLIYLFALSALSLLLSTIVSLAQNLANPASGLGMGALLVASAITFVIGLPIALVFSYVGFGVMHVLLKIFGGKATFLQTVQVYIYGGTPMRLFGWIPCIGLIGALIALVNIVLGLKRVHNISLLKTVLVVIGVPLLIVLILVGIAVLFMGSLLGAYLTAIPSAPRPI